MLIGRAMASAILVLAFSSGGVCASGAQPAPTFKQVPLRQWRGSRGEAALRPTVSQPAADRFTLPASWDGGFFTPLPNVPRDPRSGLYAIWYSQNPKLLDLPFIKGGQVMVQWATVEPSDHRYDWSALDRDLAALAARNLSTTIQLNGNDKPDWLFDVVPHHPGRPPFQMQDPQGTLMFWHPVFVKDYVDLVAAFAEHIRNSPYKKNILGVRMNFNAVGTETPDISPDWNSLDQWIVPKGAQQGPAHTPQTARQYQETVLDAFVKDFDGVSTVFVRGTIDPDLARKYQKEFDSGKLAWFYTGMMDQAFSARWGKPFYAFDYFFLFCRAGKTLGYGEPLGDAWGNQGASRTPREAQPAPALYWQTLLELHCGLSFIACYGADLEVANSGRLPGINAAGMEPRRGNFRVNAGGTDSQLREEFREIFSFGAKYAGFHASPEQSPGAWIALRQVNKTDNRQNLDDVLGNDCTFLMKRLADTSKPVTKVGDEKSRFYGYARLLPKGETMTLVLDPLFSKSLAGKELQLNVRYFDNASGSFSIKAAGEEFTAPMKNSGEWQLWQAPIKQADFASGKDQIVISSDQQDLTLHMVELVREPAIIK